MAAVWTVYILQCADRTLYTGITTDLVLRLAKHASGKGAKYTRGRGPYVVVYQQEGLTKAQALTRELEIKRLSKEQKFALAGMA